MENKNLNKNKKEKTKAIRESDKKIVLEQLKKIPIIQLTCEKTNVPRSNFYRWRKDDKEFGRKVDEALIKGKDIVNDLAESKLISSIKDGNMTGIIYWLKNNHSNYKNRLEVTAISEKDELTPEQKEVVKKALLLGPLSENNSDKKYEKNKKEQGN